MGNNYEYNTKLFKWSLYYLKYNNYNYYYFYYYS